MLVPMMVYGLVRLNRAYETEDEELHEDAQALAEAHTMRTHSVVVLVDDLDAATARAIQYARTLQPDDLRAVHFDLDLWKTDMLVKAWATSASPGSHSTSSSVRIVACRVPRSNWRRSPLPTTTPN